jgi:hypothetical protein
MLDCAPVCPRASERYVVSMKSRAGLVRAFVAGPPEWTRDSVRLRWRVV